MQNLHKKALRALNKAARQVHTSGKPYVVTHNGNIKRVTPTKNNYKFFQNTDCKYYPCHKGLTSINCMFCYCPLFTTEQCQNKLQFDCANCLFPHKRTNYKKVVDLLE